MGQKPNIRVFYTKLSLAWGFIVRHKGASASQPAYLLPPPPTIVGSIAYAVGKYFEINKPSSGRERYGSGIIISPLMKTFLKSTIVATASIIGNIGLVAHMELGKIVASMYKTGGQVEDIKKAKPDSSLFYEKALPTIFPVLAQGAVYGPAELEILWAFDVEKLSRDLGIELKELDGGLPKALMGITRLGSKESIVAIEPSSVKYSTDAKIIGAGDIFTSRFYLPSECVKPCDLISIYMYDLDYEDKTFYVPSASLSLSSGSAIIPLTYSQLRNLQKLSIRSGCIGIAPDEESYKEGIVGVARVRS